MSSPSKSVEIDQRVGYVSDLAEILTTGDEAAAFREAAGDPSAAGEFPRPVRLTATLRIEVEAVECGRCGKEVEPDLEEYYGSPIAVCPDCGAEAER